MTGKQILNYKIEKLIGEGGMGSVYLGVHTHIGRKVAIKALNPALAKNPDIRERFKNEASTLSQLHHPNIVTLYDYIENGNDVFLVMEYAEGIVLDEYISTITGPVPEDKAIPLFLQILDGVEYAHKRNVIHRDIKPSNIIITPDGKAKILDFGIAKIMSGTDHKLTKTGSRLGTVLYMSPEQVKGAEVDRGTDIYSLGITLFQLITARCPYNDQQSEYEVYKKIVEEPLPEARSFYVGVSQHMEAVIKKATAKDPSERFADCSGFKKALQGDTAITEIVKATPPVSQNKLPQQQHIVIPKLPHRKANPWLTFWAVLFALLFTTGIAGGIYMIAAGTDSKYVIADKLLLRSSKSLTEDNKLATLNFGEKIRIMEAAEKPGSDGLTWAEVKSPEGSKGFVALEYLGTKDDYEQIRSIFSEEARKNTTVLFKKAVQKFYIKNNMIGKDNIAKWKVNSSSVSSEFHPYVSADFNKDNIGDYACVSANYSDNTYLLLVIFGAEQNQSNIILERIFTDEIGLKKIDKGSRYFTGKYKTDYNIDWFGNITPVKSKVYTTLASDCFLLSLAGSQVHYLYVYNLYDKAYEIVDIAK